MTKVIKQTDKVSCVACVAAMATNTSVSEFRKFFGTKPPPHNDLDFYKYLLSRGYAVGVGYAHKETSVFMNRDTGLKVHFRLHDYPAYVVVKSQRFKAKTHVLYWDGEKIFDPNPEIKEDGLSVNEYDILSWFPIINFKADGERDIPDSREFEERKSKKEA